MTIERGRIAAVLRDCDARRRTEIIEQITDAIGRTPDDEELFFDDLYGAAVYADALDPLEMKLAAERIKRIEQAHKHIKKLDKLLQTDWWIKAGIGEHLSRLSDALKQMEAYQARMRGGRKNKREVSANESLAGITLPVIFERHCGGAVKYRRDGNRTPEGEVIAFVEAAMRGLGRFYARGSIGKATTVLKAERNKYRAELNQRDRQLGKIKQK